MKNCIEGETEEMTFLDGFIVVGVFTMIFFLYQMRKAKKEIDRIEREIEEND